MRTQWLDLHCYRFHRVQFVLDTEKPILIGSQRMEKLPVALNHYRH